MIVLLGLVGFAGPANGADMKESWYMSRGKSNMKIKNYKAAIEAFEKLTELNPDNQEAMRLLGTAYESEGLTDKAIAQYDRYLERFPKDADIAFKQAGFLDWSRYAYRKKDAVKYYRMGLAVKEHRENRIKLAKLLAGDKSTAGEAIGEYKKLLASNPEDKQLHSEYVKLLLWDERYRQDAISEYEKMARKNPDNLEYNHQLAKLYAKDKAHQEDAKTQYQKLVEKNPANIELREEYIKSLTKGKKNFSETKTQYEILLKKRDRLETRLAYADLLAGEESTYDQAVTQYARLTEKNPGRIDIRTKYADLLLARKENIEPAMAQYNIILQKDPENAAAHEGLAHAYSWSGNNDMAIYHSRKALAQQPKDKETAGLEKDLMKGREPRIYTDLRYFNQSGDNENYKLSGFSAAMGGRGDLTPFLTGLAEIGYEKFWKDEDDLIAKTLMVSLQYRFDPEQNADFAFTHHFMDHGQSGTEFLLQYNLKKPNYTVTPGIKRELRYDSLLAIGGGIDKVTAKKIGAARANKAFCALSYQGEGWKTAGTPYAGFVSADTAGSNAFYGVDADLDYSLMTRGAFSLSVLDLFGIVHYDKDHSGFVDRNSPPYPGGYYSPRIFVNNALDLQVTYAFDLEDRFTLRAGPCYQFSENHSADTASKLGVNGRMEYLKRFQERWYFNAAAQYDQVADQYNKFTVMGLVTYIFVGM